MSSTVGALLTRHSAPRTRTLDEHMFTVERPGPRPATFRLQLFTAPGTRPVAIATQTDREGQSLTNAAETYAAAVWERHFPHEAEPPIWIQRQLLPSHSFDFFSLVTFACDGHFQLRHPQWDRLGDAELTRLVGAPVDAERGHGYVPRPPEPEDEIRYRTIWVARLPRPRPFRADDCMPHGISTGRLLARQLAPRRQARACCWYHGGDWHQASANAIRLVRQARRADVRDPDIYTFALDQAEAEGIDGWQLEALEALLSPGTGIQLTVFAGYRETSYINGQHRSQALMEAGVRRTIVVDLLPGG